MLNERSKRILGMLLDAQHFITIERFAQLLRVSERTVRYDLDRIDDWLFENCLPKMSRTPGQGLLFPGTTGQRGQARELIGAGNPKYYVLSPEERVGSIISELLQRSGFSTIDQLAERLSVSRSTIVSDMVSVRRHLEQYGLTLTSRRHYGLQIVGDEKIIRRCVVDLLCRHISQSLTLFDGLDIQGVEGSVKQIEQKLDTTFSDLAFSRLVLYLGFSLKRLQLEHAVAMTSSETGKLRGLPTYLVVELVLRQIGSHFNIRIPVEEIAYITEQVLTSSVSSANAGIPMIDLQLAASRLITLVGAELRQDLLSDPQLFQGLVVHMGPAIQRGRVGAPLTNPHMEDIKKYQQALFDVVSNSTARLKEQVGTMMVEDEVGYLTLHFAAAIERSKLGQLRQNVLLVCGAGLGTAKLLSAKLTALFNVNVIGIVGMHQVDALLKNQSVDVIVTTIPLDRITGIPCIKVSPLLIPEDIEHLRGALREQNRSDLSFHSILRIVRKYCIVADEEGLGKELARYFGIEQHRASESLSLDDLLTERFVTLDAEAGNWEEAVRIGGELLQKERKVEADYVKGMVDAIKQLGPYVVIAKGIALPHAPSRAGVNAIGMSFVRLKQPVFFGASENDPVDLIFTFSTPDQTSHVRALHQLSRLMADESALTLLRETRSMETVLEIFSDNSF